jgi:hypothetical protein
MTLYLEKDISPHTWIIVSKDGNVVSGPKFFLTKTEAENWARQFVSSWSGAKLVIK